MKYSRELAIALEAARKASKAILEIYNQSDLGIEIKSDNSPVTKADKKSNEIICDLLREKFPKDHILSEEMEDDKSRLKANYLWIIDPLDGTKDFIAHNDEFAVLIAYCYRHEAILGVCFIPAKNECYYAVKNFGAFCIDKNNKTHRIKVNDKIDDLTILTSRFHFMDKEKEMIEKHKDKIKTIQTCGAAIKACLIAHGKAELSYRFTDQTKEWDTAAVQIIVEEAGGIMVKPDGKRMKYNREDVYNREGYIIANKKENILL